MTAFNERQRAELRDAMARSRLAAAEESRRLAGLGSGATGAHPSDGATVLVDRPPSSSTDAPQKRADVDEVLALPEAQPVIRRIGESVDPDYPHRAEHVAAVAAVVVKAKMHPTNAYAKATLQP